MRHQRHGRLTIVEPRPQRHHVTKPVAAGDPLDGDRQASNLLGDQIHHAVDPGGMAGRTLKRNPDGERGGGIGVCHAPIYREETGAGQVHST